MHTVIIGVGGVGGYFGGKIAASGQQVTFIARGKHLEEIREKGLQVKSIQGDFVVNPCNVTSDIDEVAKADLILICTKSWQVADAGTMIQPFLKEDTLVIPLQNGADNAEKLLSVLDAKYVIGGLCKIYSKIEAPGIISHFGHPPEVVFGELDATKTSRLLDIKKCFDQAGFNNRIADDIQVEIWSKFMFIATVSGLGALTRISIGRMYEDVNVRNLLKQTATEIYKIALAKGVNMPDTIVDDIMFFISKQPYDATASTQRDILEGRPSELDNFNGYIVREGLKLGIPTPVNAFTYHCLLPTEKAVRKSK